MAVTRVTLLGGPAAATFQGKTFFARDGIVVTPAITPEALDSDALGVIDASEAATAVAIRFTPEAPWPDLAALYPHLAGAPGASLAGSADMPLAVTAANGARLTFPAVALTQMPDLHLGARDPVAGPVTFTVLGARDRAAGSAGRLVAFDTAPAVPLPPPRTPQLAGDFTVSWGEAAPWTGLRTREGVRVAFRLAAEPVESDANGPLDLTLAELAVEVRFQPAAPDGPGEADLAAALALEGLPGRALSAAARGRLGELVFRASRAGLETNAPEALAELNG